MLILVSDFHLMDGTAGEHHLPPGIFRSAFTNVGARAVAADPDEIKIVFLGDVFELVRTERWFDYPPEQRPWGAEPSEDAAADILERVIAANQETFDMLGGSFVEQFGFPVEPQRVFIPGNHDRGCGAIPRLRARVREVLGISDGDPQGRFPQHLLDIEHGVFARHGHEWDAINFSDLRGPSNDGLDRFSEEQYDAVSLGEVLACELFSKIPLLVHARLPDSHPYRARLVEHMRHLYDVRPLAGLVPWISWQIDQYGAQERAAVHRAIVEAVHDVRRLPFVKEWIARNRRRGRGLGDWLDLQLRLFEFVDINKARFFLQLADKIVVLLSDKYAVNAASDFQRLDSDPRIRERVAYVCYGHTHVSRRTPLAVLGDPPNERYRIYINTGTWRPTHRMLAGSRGFASLREVTFTAFYRPGEVVYGDHATTPSAESWTGVIVAGRGRRATSLHRIPRNISREGRSDPR